MCACVPVECVYDIYYTICKYNDRISICYKQVCKFTQTHTNTHTCYSVRGTVYAVRCTVYVVYTVTVKQCTAYSVHYTVYTALVHSVLHSYSDTVSYTYYAAYWITLTLIFVKCTPTYIVRRMTYIIHCTRVCPRTHRSTTIPTPTPSLHNHHRIQTSKFTIVVFTG